MRLKQAILFSSIAHVVVFLFLASGIAFSWPDQVDLPPLQARVVIKNKDKNLLPKKPKAASVPEKVEEPPKEKPKEEEKKTSIPAPDAPVTSKEVVLDPKKKSPKNTDKFQKTLASLSQNFARDLAKEEVVETEGEEVFDLSYFDQVYSLIKESFVVPPHINGPAGRTLQTVVRIFLASDGSLIKVDLEASSGDEHFDKAVMDGTRRVNNFGAVPILLRGALSEKGIVVELCPFTCVER